MKLFGILVAVLFSTCLQAHLIDPHLFVSQPRLKHLPDGFEMIIPLSDHAKIRSFALRHPPRYIVDIYDAHNEYDIIVNMLTSPYFNAIRTGVDDDWNYIRIVYDLHPLKQPYTAKVRVSENGEPQVSIRLTGLSTAELRVQPTTRPESKSIPAPTPTLKPAPTPKPSPLPVPNKIPKTIIPITKPKEPSDGIESKPQEAILPVYINDKAHGDLYAVLAPSESWGQLQTIELLNVLKPVMESQAFTILQKKYGTQELLSFTELKQQGISVQYDPVDNVLRLSILPKLRQAQVLNINSHQQQEPEFPDIRAQATVSGALDVFVSENWLDSNRMPASSEIDGHVNLYKWVLLNRHGYLEDRNREWQRRETQLIRDYPEKRLRLSAGDVNYPFSGLMSNRQLSGISFATNFDLQPYRISFPVSEEAFFLEHDSRIEVYVDQQLRSSANLPAGQHSVYDLPLVNGINEVRLDITDIFGRRQSLRFFETQDQRLLDPELFDFSITAGVPRNILADGIDYDTDTPAVTAFFRSGISKNLTAGAHLESNEDITMVGITALHVSQLGSLEIDLATSRDKKTDHASAPAGILNYIYSTRKWSFSANYTWQDENFSTLGQNATANNLHYSARVGATFPTINGWSSNLSVTESERWSGQNQQSQRFSLSHSINSNWRLGIDLSHRDDGDGKKDSEVAMQWYWTPSSKRYQSSFGYHTENSQSNAEVSYHRQGELGLDTRATLLDDDIQQQQRLDISYTAPLLETRLNATQTKSANTSSQNTQSLSFGTSLAFADGAWSISRPLKGQPFAILTGKPSLGSGQVGIIRGTGNLPYSYLNGADDTAVLPNLGPYYINEIGLDSSALPLEVQMDSHQYRLKPGFRSGTRIDVGVDGKVYLVSQLYDAQQQAVIYQAGILQSIERPQEEPILFFTDQDGHFEVADLKAGDYTLRIKAVAGYEALINIPEGSFGRVELEPIQLRALK